VNSRGGAPLSPVLAHGRRTHVALETFRLRGALRARFGVRSAASVATSRTSPGSFRLRGQRGPRALERRARRLTGELSSSNVPSSTRVATSPLQEELETPLEAPTWPRSPSAAAPRRATVSERPRCFAPLRNPSCRRSRDDSTSWSAPRDCSRERRPGSAQCHAAPHVSVIVEALLQRVAPFFPLLPAPRPDEPSAARRFGRTAGGGRASPLPAR